VAGVCIALTVGCCWAAGDGRTELRESECWLLAVWPCCVIRSCFLPCLLSKLNESLKCVTAVTVAVVTILTVTMATAVTVTMATAVTAVTVATAITIATAVSVTTVTVVTMVTAVT
jgi:hypothetical protein